MQSNADEFYLIFFSQIHLFHFFNFSLPADHTYGHWAVLSSPKAKHWPPKTQLHFWHKLGHSRPHQSLAISIRLLSSLVLVLPPLVLLVQVCVSRRTRRIRCSYSMAICEIQLVTWNACKMINVTNEKNRRNWICIIRYRANGKLASGATIRVLVTHH